MFGGKIFFTVSYSADTTQPFFASTIEGGQGGQYHSGYGMTAVEAVTNLMKRVGESLQQRIEAQERIELADRERLEELRKKYQVVK
jgi:hypothetical protein